MTDGVLLMAVVLSSAPGDTASLKSASQSEPHCLKNGEQVSLMQPSLPCPAPKPCVAGGHLLFGRRRHAILIAAGAWASH